MSDDFMLCDISCLTDMTYGWSMTLLGFSNKVTGLGLGNKTSWFGLKYNLLCYKTPGTQTLVFWVKDHWLFDPFNHSNLLQVWAFSLFNVCFFKNFLGKPSVECLKWLAKGKKCKMTLDTGMLFRCRFMRPGYTFRAVINVTCNSEQAHLR